MKVSVIIISYMAENYIEQCLISALSQKTNFEYEILVRDDFSSDRSSEYIKRISEVNKNVIFFEATENYGATKNFDFLYSKCKGEYIAILDGDDYWDNSNFLQNSVDYLENNKDIVMTFTGHRVKDNFGNITPPNLGQWIGLCGFENDIVKTEHLLTINYVGFGKVFRRIDDLLKPWMYELPFLDWGLNIEISKKGDIKFLNFSAGIYRVHGNGIFSSLNSEELEKLNKKSIEIIKSNINL